MVMDTLLWTRQPLPFVAELDFQRFLDGEQILAGIARLPRRRRAR